MVVRMWEWEMEKGLGWEGFGVLSVVCSST